ncbi:MAG: zinc-ribbon domain-containing protein [Nitrospinota bacterium]|nr:zinc-ribbon domain-containing protein [Nitrospinota bacterium]
MQVICSSCSRDINIPDNKVPQGQAFNLTCPGCKTKLRVDQHLKPPEPDPAEDTGPSLDTASMVVDEDFEDEDEEIEIYDEHDKIALILDRKNDELWTTALTELEYKLQRAKSPEHAVHKLKFNQYHVVVFHEKFGDTTLETSPLYEFIRDMSMDSRRKAFVALVGDKFKTLDNMEALAYSVNLVVNQKDMGELETILKKSIGENDMFYKVYRETMTALGKL